MGFREPGCPLCQLLRPWRLIPVGNLTQCGEGGACAGLSQVGCRQDSDPPSRKDSPCTPLWAGQGQDLGTSQPSPCSQGPCALMGRQTKLILQAAVSDMKKANRACGTSFSVPEGVPAPHCLSTIHLLAPLLTQPQCWWYGYDDSSENVSQLPLQQGLPMR